MVAALIGTVAQAYMRGHMQPGLGIYVTYKTFTMVVAGRAKVARSHALIGL